MSLHALLFICIPCFAQQKNALSAKTAKKNGGREREVDVKFTQEGGERERVKSSRFRKGEQEEGEKEEGSERKRESVSLG